MKRRIFIGSIFVVFFIALVPVTNAIQIKTVHDRVTQNIMSFQQFKNMDTQELIVFLQILAHLYKQQMKYNIEATPKTIKVAPLLKRNRALSRTMTIRRFSKPFFGKYSTIVSLGSI